ncbi:hypothetical protein NQZ68_032208 [Dissostichus eleginoides]|nr:hypothetical protein NQZ68_032208 [Dissostichus eleginoides]
MLIEDWIRDLQYLLEAVELPTYLRFSTAVQHLGGEARKLVLNLPPHDQTPEKAFEELRAEYGDTQGSLDPLADFYERSQSVGGNTAGCRIKSKRGPFPDRDCKLTRQLLRGLIDEEVYTRISPMKPLLFSFRELQAELRNLAKESKRFQSQNKAKKTYAQVHVTTEGSSHPLELQSRVQVLYATGVGRKDIQPVSAEQCSQIPIRPGHANHMTPVEENRPNSAQHLNA